jgi:7,8-dihydropterin-6-yl-methyl-4-(beta-D-ribofuranosyl)aminobenzene 5'-phosphate synthase
MDLTIVYDDEPSDDQRLIADHGFSCWIESDDEVILFDTGTKGDILLHNLKHCGKDPSRISKIVLSHEHYDHNGGLPMLLSQLNQVTVYRIDERPSASSITSIAVREPMRIGDGICSTGRLPGSPLDEQSLIVELEHGLVVLTGCSHSGVGAILNVAGQQGKVLGLIGGFHGFSEFDVLEPLSCICPCHCTVHKKKICSMYPLKTRTCHVGSTFALDEMFL